jgi:hypothetical protein
MTHRKTVVICATTMLAGALALAGCFTTTLNLGKAADATVDVRYCGDWHVTWKDGDQTKSADLVVRNFDGKQYYVEWSEPDPDSKTLRMSGFLVPVKGATFVQLTGLDEKGELPADHMIARIDMDGAKLKLRHLNEGFFKEVSSDAALRATMEKNVENDAMYAGEAVGAKKESE